MNLTPLFEKAKQSKFALKKLNFILLKGIPFNGPHKFKIMKIDEGYASVHIPYIRKNKNHIKGMHACCLATASEYVTGLVLLSNLDPLQYRLIMKNIYMEYHYQAKMSCSVEYRISSQELKEEILDKVKDGNPIDYTCEVKAFDSEQNHISTGRVEWQIKSWSQVRTKK